MQESQTVGDVLEGNFTKHINRNCDEIKNMILTGAVSEAKFVIGEEPHSVVIDLKTTPSGAERFVHPEPAFPMHMIPYQQVRLVVVATGRVVVEYDEVLISFDERNKGIYEVCKIKWQDRVYVFGVFGIVQLLQEPVEHETKEDNPNPEKQEDGNHEQIFKYQSQSQIFEEQIAWKIFSSLEPYIGKEIRLDMPTTFWPLSESELIDLKMAQAWHDLAETDKEVADALDIIKNGGPVF